MKNLIVALLILLPVSLLGQKSKYYGWWEHKGAMHNQDSITYKALQELSMQYKLDINKLMPLSETEIQFNEDSFKLNYGISVLTGDDDSRDFKWFTSLSGTWKIDNNGTFRNKGKLITIRENNFTVGEDNWKDSIVNHTIRFTSKNADLVALKFNDGTRAYGVFNTQVSYPYVWFYLEYGFGNIYTKFY
jgi:hypothetical protein